MARFPVRTLGAGLAAILALGYTTWQIWTALALSAGAPAVWRSQLLLLEGGVPLIYAVSFAGIAWGAPRLRRLGWLVVALLTLALIGWTWFTAPGPAQVDPRVVPAAVLLARLDPATRHHRVEAACRTYGARLFACGAHYCTRWALDETLAQDAVQDVFAALLDAASDTDRRTAVLVDGDSEDLKRYLFNAVIGRIKTLARSARRRATAEAAGGEALYRRFADSPADLHDGLELETYLQAVIDRCPARAAHAYRLVHDWDFSYKDAAAVMGISAQAIGAHVYQVAQRLHAAVLAWQALASAEVA